MITATDGSLQSANEIIQSHGVERTHVTFGYYYTIQVPLSRTWLS